MTDTTAGDDVEVDAGAEGEDGADGAEKKGGRKKLILIAAAALLLVGGGGAGAYFMGLLDPLLGGGGVTEEETAQAAPLKSLFYELPEMTVNLASSGGRAQYLKVRVSLEMTDREAMRAIPPIEPRILDAFQVHLRELRSTDLEGSMGIYRLKEELLRRVNVAVYPFKVDRVLFNEMLVQ